MFRQKCSRKILIAVILGFVVFLTDMSNVSAAEVVDNEIPIVIRAKRLAQKLWPDDFKHFDVSYDREENLAEAKKLGISIQEYEHDCSFENPDLLELVEKYEKGPLSKEEMIRLKWLFKYPDPSSIVDLKVKQELGYILTDEEKIMLYWLEKFPYDESIAVRKVEECRGELTKEELVELEINIIQHQYGLDHDSALSIYLSIYHQIHDMKSTGDTKVVTN